MGMYRKKAVIIEARQWTGSNAVELLDWIKPTAIQDGSTLVIPTLEGDHEASLGDWIICGVKGEFYPCKPDIFAMTYEEASAAVKIEAPEEPQTKAVADVLAERKRQVEMEGFTPEHDDRHNEGQIAYAAATYAAFGGDNDHDRHHGGFWKVTWPWGDEWWKPTDRRRDLVKAAALILAEIERLDRAEARAR